MKLATITHPDRWQTAARIEDDGAVPLGVPDVGALLSQPNWAEIARTTEAPALDLAEVAYLPVVPNPAKIICVGLNYGSHIDEIGLPRPQYPTLFSKFSLTLTGATHDIALSTESAQFDWEAELAVVIGQRARRVEEHNAETVIAGFTVANDVSARDWQTRNDQWLPGKIFEATTPLGPWLVTHDEAGNDHELECELNGEVVQQARTSDLVFGPAALISYLSRIITLEPGDVILTGTPGGVGVARNPPRFLADGDELITRISGIGECRNIFRQRATA